MFATEPGALKSKTPLGPCQINKLSFLFANAYALSWFEQNFKIQSVCSQLKLYCQYSAVIPGKLLPHKEGGVLKYQ